jgi:hypothetical protein
MINLIPNEEKKAKVKDFYFRLTVVLFFILGFSAVIASITILPAYFLSAVKKNVAVSKLETKKKESLPPLDQEALTAASDLENKLVIAETNKQRKYVVSQEVVSKILLKKMADIKISEISYTEGPKGKQISLAGTAPNRERLLMFRKILEDDLSFKEVDLPISNFIRGSNIEFSLTLTPY